MAGIHSFVVLDRIKRSIFCIALLQILAASALKCYVCQSSNTERQPTCDKAYWKQMDKVQWDNLSVVCLDHASDFCIVTWTKTADGLETKRGCMSKYDSQGVRLNVGCIEVSDDEKSCLCQDDLCNVSPPTVSTVWRFSFVIGVSIFFMFLAGWFTLYEVLEFPKIIITNKS